MTLRQIALFVFGLSLLFLAFAISFGLSLHLSNHHKTIKGIARSHLTTSEAAHVTDVVLYADRDGAPLAHGVRAQPTKVEATFKLIAWDIPWDTRFLVNGKHVLVIRVMHDDKIVGEESEAVDVEN